MFFVKNIRIGFRRHPLFENLSFAELKPGTMATIIGPNGAGKSTLLRTIAGLHPMLSAAGSANKSGKAHPEQPPIITLGEIAIENLSLQQRVKHIGFVPQVLPQASSLSPYEVIFSSIKSVQPDLNREEADQRIEPVFRKLEMDSLAFEPMHTLSGGQRQIVSVAQILVRRPQLLLLDEPTSALDLRWQLKVFEALQDQVKSTGAVCLMVMHDLNLALRVSDYLIALSAGHLLAEGAPVEVITPAIIRQIYGVIGRIETCSQGRPWVIADETV